MANVKISQLPVATTPLTGAELLPVVQSGITRQTTVNALNDVNVQSAKILLNIAALQALSTATSALPTQVQLTSNYVAGDGGGVFRYDSTDTTSADNGGTVIVDSTGRRWKRQFTGEVYGSWFGVRSDGTTDDRAALQAATNTGRPVVLKSDTTTLISQGISHVAGSGLVCLDGIATVRAKTGVGGFTVVSSAAPRTGTDRNMYFCNQTDDLVWRNVVLETDGATEVVLSGIYLYGGMATTGYDIKGSGFSGFWNGACVRIASVGAGARRNLDISYARNCGATLGNTYYSGGCQMTVIEIDNDLIASTASQPGVITVGLIENILLTGTALTDFGQQTDGLNIVSQGANSTSGWTATIGVIDKVGEPIDIQGRSCTITVGTIRRAYNDAVKLIHNASHNTVTVGEVDESGRFVVGIFGSDSVVANSDTTGNVVKIGTVRRPGTYGLGLSTTTSVVGFGNSNSTYKPVKNTVTVDNVIGDGVNLDYAVLDGGAGIDNENLVIISRANGYAVLSCLAPPRNVRVQYMGRCYAAMTISADQTIATATDTTVAFNTVTLDTEGICVTGSNKMRVIWPGLYHVFATTRWAGATPLTDGNWALTWIERSGVAASATVAASGANQELVGIPSVAIYVDENDLGSAGADFIVRVRQDSGFNRTISTARTQFVAVRAVG